MKTKKLVLSAILLGLGTILHFITPPLLFGVKPDFLLVMAFTAILIARDLKSTLIISLTAGFIAALTTGFPMGQIPNIIDKLVAGFFVYFIYKSKKFDLNLTEIAIVAALGTLLSGVIFLLTGLFLIGQLEMFFESMPIVLITMPINAVVGVLVYKSFLMSLKVRSR